jgi:hypothetical protein
MRVGLRFYLAGTGMLLTLAGCGHGLIQYAERAPWRHDAEVACMRSGEVKLGTGVVRIEPIEGPGVCGADFPLKVSVLGESGKLAYTDDLRPPASIPNAGSDPRMPRWPANEPRYAPAVESQALDVAPVQSRPIGRPIQQGNMRWVPGPQGIERSQSNGQPMSISPPGRGEATEEPQYMRSGAAPAYPPAQRSYPPARQTYPSARENDPPQQAYRPPQQSYPPAQQGYPADQRAYEAPSDVPDDAVLPPGESRGARVQDSYAPARGSYNAPPYEPPAQPRALPPLGPMRGPNATTAMMPATLTPTATLACPIVSALDRWVSQGVQPAAMRWFGSPVATIKQISAYSCRQMVGSGTSTMSEHAYGNALDIAGFTLADGRTITVKNGWHGTPEEQGFLHDVQLYACETFTTVLAPGYNIYHYDHIHVDLMRRESGRHPCRPDAIPGDVVAAKARAIYANKHRAPAYTGSIGHSRSGSISSNAPESDRGHAPAAIPGEDGFVSEDVSGWSGSGVAAKHTLGAKETKSELNERRAEQ